MISKGVAVLWLGGLSCVLFATQTHAANPDPLLYKRGLGVYWENCASCHGINGEGNGPEADAQITPPRNFLAGNFKFRSTGPGEGPAREDIVRTLEMGIRGWQGLSMPAFSNLPLIDKFALAEVVRVYAALPEFGQLRQAPPYPGPSTPDAGAALYQELGCVDCHGSSGNGQGVLAPSLTDSTGRPIQPTNFTLGRFKGGNLPQDLWMRINTGLDGTPMPAFGNTLNDTEIWALVDYVRAFSNE